MRQKMNKESSKSRQTGIFNDNFGKIEHAWNGFRSKQPPGNMKLKSSFVKANDDLMRELSVMEPGWLQNDRNSPMKKLVKSVSQA
jgi:hypothetical protein